jgi:non-heme chloroperoxidase
MIVDTPLRVLLKTLLLNTNVNMIGELQRIRVPALVVHGDQDASAPIELTGRRTAGLLGDAALRVYPGAGHGLYASDHQTLNADILAFIRETPAPRRAVTPAARPAVTPAGTVV